MNSINIENDQAAALRNGNDGRDSIHIPTRLRCIAVGSGKGGVGKTVISVSLACSLVDKGYQVLILDADLGLANVDLQMGLDPKYTVQDVVFGNCNLEDAVMHVEKGPDVLASSSGAPEMVNMGDARRQMFVEELVKFAGNYDFFIIDVGAGIGKEIMTFLSSAPEVLVVLANEPTSIMDAYSLIKTMQNANTPPSIKLVINMVRSLNEGEELAKRLNDITKRFLNVELPLASIILYDENVGNAIRARQSLLTYASKSTSAMCIDELATYLTTYRNVVGTNEPLRKDFFTEFANLGSQAYHAEQTGS